MGPYHREHEQVGAGKSMIIGFRKQFLFVHIPKCAGESIQELLLEVPNAGGLFLRKHARYVDAERVLGPEIARFTAFAVVRNPYEQVVSFYDHLRKPLRMSKEQLDAQYPGSGGRLLPYWASDLAMGSEFPEFVRGAYGDDAAERQLPQAWWLADLCSWLTDSTGSIAVNRVLRHERLGDDFAMLARDLGLEGELPWRNASGPVDRRREYRSRYDQSTRKIVQGRFSRTLEQFGYEF